MKCENICRRYEQLKSERYTIESTWDVIRMFIAPYAGEFFRIVKSEHSVDWRNQQVFDSTAPMASQNLAASLHSGLTSPAIKWFDIRFQNNALNNDSEAQEWLDLCSQKVYDALQNSNFNLEVNETYQDLVNFGSSVIVEEVDEATSDLVFQAVPIKEAFFEQDNRGQIVRFYRHIQYTPVQIVAKFGDDAPEWAQKEAKGTDGATKKHDVIFAVYPRDKDVDTSKPLAPKERPFGFKYVRLSDKTMIGNEGGYYEMPAYIPRWRKTTDSMWGNSPAMIALPDVLTLNRLVELILKATEKVVDPAVITTERGILSDLDLSAGGLTVVRSLTDIDEFESKARFDVSQLQRTELQKAIQKYFYVDQLELKESPAMTATEVQVRYELMQRLLGPTMGRLQADFLDPLIERTFNILMRANILPPMPEVVMQAEGDLDINYVGPMNRAQKADTAVAIERWIASIGNIAQINPAILDIPDYDEIGRMLARSLAVPSSIVNTDKEVKSMRSQREKDQAQQTEMQDAMAAGAAMQQLGGGMQAMSGG